MQTVYPVGSLKVVINRRLCFILWERLSLPPRCLCLPSFYYSWFRFSLLEGFYSHSDDQWSGFIRSLRGFSSVHLSPKSPGTVHCVVPAWLSTRSLRPHLAGGSSWSQCVGDLPLHLTFITVNPQRLFIAQRSILSFMESNFSDREAKCSNFAARKKKKRSATSNVFFSFKSLWKSWEHSVYQSYRYSHSSKLPPLINLTLISSFSFTKRKSLNLSSAISSFITKVTTCWSKNILPCFLPSNYPQHPHVDQRVSLWAKQRTGIEAFLCRNVSWAL